MQQATPFHIHDTIRNTKFLALYHWAKGLHMTPSRAYYIAKNKTLKLYPISRSEPLYRNS